MTVVKNCSVCMSVSGLQLLPDSLLFLIFEIILQNVGSRGLLVYPNIPEQCIWLFWMLLRYACEELTHWKRLWCWEGLGAGGREDDRGWDGWMASPTGWTWVWVNSGRWWWTRRPGVLQFMESQRVGMTERLTWTELNWRYTMVIQRFTRHLVAPGLP